MRNRNVPLIFIQLIVQFFRQNNNNKCIFLIYQAQIESDNSAEVGLNNVDIEKRELPKFSEIKRLDYKYCVLLLHFNQIWSCGVLRTKDQQLLMINQNPDIEDYMSIFEQELKFQAQAKWQTIDLMKYFKIKQEEITQPQLILLLIEDLYLETEITESRFQSYAEKKYFLDWLLLELNNQFTRPKLTQLDFQSQQKESKNNSLTQQKNPKTNSFISQKLQDNSQLSLQQFQQEIKTPSISQKQYIPDKKEISQKSISKLEISKIQNVKVSKQEDSIEFDKSLLQNLNIKKPQKKAKKQQKQQDHAENLQEKINNVVEGGKIVVSQEQFDYIIQRVKKNVQDEINQSQQHPTKQFLDQYLLMNNQCLYPYQNENGELNYNVKLTSDQLDELLLQYSDFKKQQNQSWQQLILQQKYQQQANSFQKFEKLLDFYQNTNRVVYKQLLEDYNQRLKLQIAEKIVPQNLRNSYQDKNQMKGLKAWDIFNSQTQVFQQSQPHLPPLKQNFNYQK